MEEEWEKKLNNAANYCEEYRLQGFHCSESCIRAVAKALNIDLSEQLKKASSGFRGGGGGYGDRCGTLEAGILLISDIYGRTTPEQDVSNYSYLIRLLHERFIQELGSYYCRVLRPFAYHLSGDAQNCSYVYRNGAKIVTQLLLEANKLIANMPEHEKYGYKKDQTDDATPK